jgi:hypothetical protein
VALNISPEKLRMRMLVSDSAKKTLATLARNLAPCACSGFIKRASNLYENILPVAIRTVYLGHSNRN